MKLVRLLALTSIVSVMFAGIASALPVNFQLTTVNVADGAAPTTQTYIPPLPVLGGGTIDEALGTYNLTLNDFSIAIDILGEGSSPDATISTSGWSQTGTFAGGLGGTVTSSSTTGAVGCVANDPVWGGLICGSAPSTVAPWPPTGGVPGDPFGVAGAVIDINANTITVTEPFDALAGQIQLVYDYTVIPEPGTLLLLGGGLAGIGVVGRKRR
jgi:hypothetical protein